MATRAIHAGEPRRKYADSLTTPIIQTSTFTFKDSKDIENYTKKNHDHYEYGRYENPTVDVAEKRLANLENAGGGVVSFDIKGNITSAKKFMDALQLCYIGPSLGGVETLITHPALVSYYDYTKKDRYQIGITDTLFRLAVGIEDAEDIIKDLERGLKAIEKKK